MFRLEKIPNIARSTAGMAEAGGGHGGAYAPQILAEWKAPPGSALHYYLPTQIFKPCAIGTVGTIRK